MLKNCFSIFVLLASLAALVHGDEAEMTLDDRQMEMLIRTYPAFFVRKREEQKAFIQRMLADEEYEKRYKLFEMAFSEVLKVLSGVEEEISQMQHTKGVLPSTPKEFKYVVTVLENTCALAEIILHFPEMSYRILDANHRAEWRKHVAFAYKLTTEHYNFVYDQSTQELLNLFNQELNPDQRTEDFVNPYSEKESTGQKKKAKKEKKTREVRKGPSLQEL